MSKHFLRILCLLLTSAWLSAPLHAAEENTHTPILVGYFEHWSTFGPFVHIQDLPLERLDFIVYENAALNANAEIEVTDPFSDIYLQYPDDDMSQQDFAGTFHAMVKAKQKYPTLKTLITIGEWGSSSYFSRIASTEATRHKAADEMLAFMQKYGFDGVDIYWLFPVENNQVADSHRPEDPENFVKFMEVIRQKMDEAGRLHGKKYYLTMTLDSVLYNQMDAISKAAPVLDYIHLDTSQIYGYWDPVTNHISPLYPSYHSIYGGSVSGFVNQLEANNIPMHKVILNISPIAQGWQSLKKNGMNGLHADASQISWGSWETDKNNVLGIYSRSHLQNFMQMEEYELHWDERSRASYLFAPERFDGHFISFESEKSIREKISYLNRLGMAGIGVRNLHSDNIKKDSIVSLVYRILFPVHGTWLDFKDALIRNKAALAITFLLVTLVIAFFLIFQHLQQRQKRTDLVEQNRFDTIASQLQLMEWALLQLQQLRSYHHHQGIKLQIPHLLAFNEATMDLLKPVSFLLQETRINSNLRKPQMECISALELGNHLQLILSSNPSIKNNVRINFPDDVTLFIDPSYMVQLLISIYYLMVENISSNEAVDISGYRVNAGTMEIILGSQLPHAHQFRQQDFMRLKEIYRMANQLGTDLQHNNAERILFKLKVSVIQNAVTNRLSQWVSDQQSSKAPEGSTSSEIIQHETISETVYETTDSAYLEYLEEFSRDEESTSDITKLIERACKYFSVSIDQPLVFSIFQGEQLLIALGENDKDIKKHVTHYEIGELRFHIQSPNPLTPQDIRYFSVLINQIQMVRQTLKELAKEPVLLSEIYEISKNKERVIYIQADYGYTSIFLSGAKNPQCFSTRLRTIKQFFDDDTLLQIHRSYLINPKKVFDVKKISKYKYEFIVENKAIPISRTYLPTLKERFPHWFK